MDLLVTGIVHSLTNHSVRGCIIVNNLFAFQGKFPFVSRTSGFICSETLHSLQSRLVQQSQANCAIYSYIDVCLHSGLQSRIAMMMEAASTSQMSVNFYQTTRRYNSEDSHLHDRHSENLKSYFYVFAVSNLCRFR
jgi:hypothetical protein